MDIFYVISDIYKTLKTICIILIFKAEQENIGFIEIKILVKKSVLPAKEPGTKIIHN